MAQQTYPAQNDEADNAQTRLVVEPAWTDPATGQVYVHRDLVPQAPDWSHEAHIPPTAVAESFGDAESWAAYVTRYVRPGTLLTWNSKGLRAVLDYPADAETPARHAWTAVQPFKLSPEWQAWCQFASGRPMNQREAVEKLEDFAEDIVKPTQAELLQLLLKLKANASAQAETEIRPDGTSSVTFRKDSTVKGNGELPAVIEIAVPVLLGDGKYGPIKVRMRLSVDDNARLLFRFTLVNADRVMEQVYADRVAAAQAALGEDRQLLRADG